MGELSGAQLQKMLWRIGEVIARNPYEKAVRHAAGDTPVSFFRNNIRILEDVKLSDRDMARVDALFSDPEAVAQLRKDSPDIFKDEFFDNIKAGDKKKPDKLFDWKNSTIQERYIFLLKMQQVEKFLSDPAPFAVVTKQGGSVSCLVQRLSEDYDEKEEIAVHISGIPLSRLKPVPGTNELWQSAVGIHEGAHCGHAHEGTLLTHQVLKHEIEADQETVNWLRESGLHDMAQALVDYRILAAVFKGNISHVSSLFITENREPHILEEKHIIDVINLKTKIVDAVVAESGMKRFDVWDGLGFELEFKPEDEEQLVNETGFIENQNKILDTLEALLKRGAFDDTAHYSPHMKALIETFLGACNRQIEGRTVKPGMDYGRIAPVNDKPAIQAGDGAPVRSSDGAPVRVGGHSDLSGIFGAVADPNAPNRILVEHKHEHGSNVEGAAPGLKAPMH